MLLEHGPSRMNTKNDQIDTTQDASHHHSGKAKRPRKKWRTATKKKKTETMRSQQTMRKKKKKYDCSKNSEGETEEGNSSNTECDQDMKVAFMEHTDVDIDTTEIEEDWIEYRKITTRLAEEKMRTGNIRCWTMTHTKMKWRLRNASQPETRW